MKNLYALLVVFAATAYGDCVVTVSGGSRTPRPTTIRETGGYPFSTM